MDYCSPYSNRQGICQMSHKKSIGGCFRWIFVHTTVFTEQAGLFQYRHHCALSCLIASGPAVLHAHKAKKHMWLLCESLHFVIQLAVVATYASFLDIKEGLPTIFRRYIGHSKVNRLMRSSYTILPLSLQIKIHDLGAMNLDKMQHYCFDQSEVLKCTFSDHVFAVALNGLVKS